MGKGSNFMISEHRQCEEWAQKYPEFFRISTLKEVKTENGYEPLIMFELHAPGGNKDVPVLGLFAGVHGIEAIGVKILMNFLDHLLAQVSWNHSIQNLLRKVRIVGIPIVNPYGFVQGTRCNGQGVDLMRNAPIESSESILFFGGQKMSPTLPYFRGFGRLEKENEALLDVIQRHLLSAPFSLSLDLHSGFGLTDFLWTPYAKQSGLPPTWESYKRIHQLLDNTLRQHVYTFQPQSMNYCTSGDIWDFVYEQSLQAGKKGHFLPLTLEVGSWAWVRKSPGTALKLRSFFNPAHPHRERRVLRRHLALLNLLAHICANSQQVFEGLLSPPSYVQPFEAKTGT